MDIEGDKHKRMMAQGLYLYLCGLLSATVFAMACNLDFVVFA